MNITRLLRLREPGRCYRLRLLLLQEYIVRKMTTPDRSVDVKEIVLIAGNEIR